MMVTSTMMGTVSMITILTVHQYKLRMSSRHWSLQLNGFEPNFKERPLPMASYLCRESFMASYLPIVQTQGRSMLVGVIICIFSEKTTCLLINE